MILALNPQEQDSLLTILAHNPDAKLLKRVQIVLGLAGGVGPAELARRVGCSRSTVYRIGRRFEQAGLAGLDDGRAKLRGPRTAPSFLAKLGTLLGTTPRACGWERSTWSCELLSLELARQGEAKKHPATVWRLLRSDGFRYNRARPTLVSPDPDKEAKLAALAELRANLPADERLFFADELDVHLNPKIGRQWTPKSQQPTVVTPGNNRKRYIAGALDPLTKEMVWVCGLKKNSVLFLHLCKALGERYPDARLIHVIADNYIIHRSKLTRHMLRYAGTVVNIRVHFLPTYSPEHNPIEREWLDVHTCVTRNHDAKDIDELLARVETHLRHRDQGGKPSVARAS
jgi:transposase